MHPNVCHLWSKHITHKIPEPSCKNRMHSMKSIIDCDLQYHDLMLMKVQADGLG